MASRLSLLSVSDPRGDLDLVSKAVALAQHSDVRAQGLFFLGNFCGPLLTPPEFLAIEQARRVLLQELKTHERHYLERDITTVWRIVNEIALNPDTYRRGPEVGAARTVHTLIGRRDDAGRFLEIGSAAKRARGIYVQAMKLFAKSKVPCYLMADTVFAEEIVPEEQWLHFSWVSLGGYTIRCLGASEIEDPDAIPDYFTGARRGGKAFTVEGYPMGSADVIFSYVLNPALHDVLSTSQGRLVVMCGDGRFDTGYAKNIVATQRPGAAYAYTLEGPRVVRRIHEFAGGEFKAGPLESGNEEGSSRISKQAERATRIRLAGLGQDLVVFCDLMRRENPDLADQMERASNRGEAVFRYVQYLEAQRQSLLDSLAADRVGLERLASRLLPYLDPGQAARMNASLNDRPEVATATEARDRSNERLADLFTALLAERFGPPA